MEIFTKLYPRSVFVAGEQVRCSVQFQLKPSPSSPSSSSSRGGPPRRSICVAWASVQLQCECVMASDSGGGSGNSVGGNPSVGAGGNVSSGSGGGGGGAGLGESGTMTRNSSRTSFRPVDWLEGAQIMSSSPKLLFCELVLREGDVKTFTYCESLPCDIPPSYRGKNIKFFYHVLIGTQLLNSSVEVLKVPFRVLTSPLVTGDAAVSNYLARHLQCEREQQQQLSIANPFLKAEDAAAAAAESNGGVGDDGDGERPQPQDLYSSNWPPMRQPALYDIAVASGQIAKLSIPRKSFRMGEEIIAALSFPSKSEVSCLQYSVSLVSEEEIFRSEAGPGGKKILASRSHNKVTKTQDFTIGYEESCLRLEIPLFATPSFSSALCSLTWRLQFEFVVMSNRDLNPVPAPPPPGAEDYFEWNAPQRLQVQTLEWRLPITVYAADPVQVEWLQTTKSQTHAIFASRDDRVKSA